MSIEEVMKLKQNAEQNILGILAYFESSTGLPVSHISLDKDLVGPQGTSVKSVHVAVIV